MDKTAVVVLAAGHGTRMKSELPKVMHELGGKPLIGHVVDNMIASGITDRPIVVVSPDGDLVREYLGARVDYAIQEEQLGTGHATMAAKSVVSETAEYVVVVFADLPFLRGASLAQLVETHAASQAPVTMFTTTVPSFENQWQAMYSFGRIVRNQDGAVESITEMKDCTDEQKTIRELNTGLFCFRADWMWAHLEQLSPDNAQGEYYLTDLVEMAIAEGASVGTVALAPEESFGISSQEDLEKAHGL